MFLIFYFFIEINYTNRCKKKNDLPSFPLLVKVTQEGLRTNKKQKGGQFFFKSYRSTIRNLETVDEQYYNDYVWHVHISSHVGKQLFIPKFDLSRHFLILGIRQQYFVAAGRVTLSQRFFYFFFDVREWRTELEERFSRRQRLPWCN